MPRRSKGPRLWFRPARAGRAGAWFVLDGSRQFGTGLGIGATEQQKADALRSYLETKHTAAATTGTRDPANILIDDVLALYARVKLPGWARPKEGVAYIAELRKFWGGRPLSDVTGLTCRAYAAQRTTASVARHELELLRSAINLHRLEGLHDRVVSVVLPGKPVPRERWLTKAEAAALIRAAWRYREKQGGPMAGRRTRRHVARFMVVARYMGSRAAVICGASLEDKRPPGRPWVDLRTGIFHGKPEGHRETKKRRQVVAVPRPLLAHMRRWRANGQRYVVQWNGKPVGSITKAHAAAVADAGLGADVTPHVWRHTVATWLADAGVNAYEAADFLAMSRETYLRVYVGRADRRDFGSVHRAL